MNVPAPTTEGGATPEEIKLAADKESPPSSFYELQRASVKAARTAMADGHRLLEIEVRFYFMIATGTMIANELVTLNQN